MTRTQAAPSQAQTQYRDDDDFSRLMSKNARIGGLYKTLSAADHNIEAMLPDFMKGQADRLIRRALITFSKTPDLDGITDEAFRRCVIEAAEMGFAIDGRLCYVVKYKSNYQLQLDYKAVVAVAKRNRTIKDIDSDVVCKNDTFRHGKFNGESILEHTFDMSGDRGEVVGAYCRVFLPDGGWNYEVMTRTQLDSVQRRAPAQNGPWKTDPDEMRKKTVIRRKLKLYQDDPGLMRMLEITGWQDGDDEDEERPQTVDDLGKRLTAARAQTASAREQSPPPEYGNGNSHHAEPEDERPDSGERPQVTNDIDEAAVARARESFGVAQDEQGVQFELDAMAALEMNDKTREKISELAHDRRAALREAEKGPAKGGKRQGELVK